MSGAFVNPESPKFINLHPDQPLDPASLNTPLAFLDISNNTQVTTLPDGLRCDVIKAVNCKTLTHIGAGIHCRELILDSSSISSVPEDINIEFRLSAQNCQRLKTLPSKLHIRVLSLQYCLALETLPAGLSTAILDLTGCSALKALPDDLRLNGGRLGLRDCPLIETIPAGAGYVAQLDISGCRKITHVPETFRVTSWIDVGGSGVTGMPPQLAGIGLRWRSVPVDERIAFRPETLTVDEILAESNAELLRIMLERFGFERFMCEVKAEILDEDRDPAGKRQLLRVPLENDEDLVCVSVYCPSTFRRYFLRVPPTMQSCRQAIAWTAGFDNPDDYAPLAES